MADPVADLASLKISSLKELFPHGTAITPIKNAKTAHVSDINTTGTVSC